MIEHRDTHEQIVRRGQIAIRNLERLVIDCVLQPYDPNKPRCEPREGYNLCHDVPWTACPASATVDPVWGTPVSMWVYGEGGGLAIATTTTIPVAGHPLSPKVEFSGLTLSTTDYAEGTHANAGASSVAEMFASDLKITGTLRTAAYQDQFAANAIMELTAP